jgi:hypothetical protein
LDFGEVAPSQIDRRRYLPLGKLFGSSEIALGLIANGKNCEFLFLSDTLIHESDKEAKSE